MGFDEEINQQGVRLGRVEVDLVILRAMALGPVLQTVQRALAGQGLAVAAMSLQLAGQHRQGRVLAQFIVVVEVLISQRQTEDTLAHQRLQSVLDQARVAAIDEAAGEPPHQLKTPVHLPQQQRPGVGRDHTTVEAGHHLLALHCFKP
jgi:hypothetical protein